MNVLGCVLSTAIFGALWGWMPFSTNCLWFWLAKFNSGIVRYFFMALWVWQMFAPSLLAQDAKLSEIESWAGKGPLGLESSAPITGAYFINGIQGLTVADFSWCKWNAAERVLSCRTLPTQLQPPCCIARTHPHIS